MSDFSLTDAANRICGKCLDGNRLAAKCAELDIVARATVVDHHDCPSVASTQAVVGQVFGENDGVKFFDHKGDALNVETP